MEALASFHIVFQQAACQCGENIHKPVFKYFFGVCREIFQEKSVLKTKYCRLWRCFFAISGKKYQKKR